MMIPRTARFDEEARRYELRFCCEDCRHFDAATARCRHDWPTEAHRRARYEVPLADGTGEAAAQEVAFCKEFELR